MENGPQSAAVLQLKYPLIIIYDPRLWRRRLLDKVNSHLIDFT